MFRELLGSLFGRRPVSAEEVVFEPLDDTGSETAFSQNIGQSISVEKLLPRVPAAWRQPANDAVHEILVLPPEAFLAGENPSALRVSLRYLARFYPSTFRDPGVMAPDPGVSLAGEDLQNLARGLTRPEAGLEALPPETVSEVAADPATFSEWEGDRPAVPQKRQEERETRRALRGVRLPPAQSGVGGDFDATLALSQTPEQEVASSTERGSAGASKADAVPQKPESPAVLESKSAAPNLRLRRILAAYAEALPESGDASGREAPAVSTQGEVPNSSPNPLPAQTSPAASAGSSGTLRVPLRRAPGESPRLMLEQRSLETAPESREDAFTEERLVELESSLGRFSQVSGYVLWERESLKRVGHLGFDPQQPGAREELERFLRSGERFGGGGDAFSSLTFHAAQGGFSVFGAGDCLLVVAHRGGEGISEALRGWLCGWVAQAASPRKPRRGNSVARDSA